MRRSASARIVLFIVSASFLVLALVSAGHLHTTSAAGAVKAHCRLCCLGQLRVADAGTVVGLAALLPVRSLISVLFLTPPEIDSLARPSPRAPPLR